MLAGVLPFLAARDLQGTLAFYEGLGFERVICEMEQTNGIHGMLSGSVELMFYHEPDLDPALAGRGVRLYLDTDDVATLHARALALGAEIIRDLEVRPWGMREFTLRDPNGYIMTFAQGADQ